MDDELSRLFKQVVVIEVQPTFFQHASLGAVDCSRSSKKIHLMGLSDEPEAYSSSCWSAELLIALLLRSASAQGARLGLSKIDRLKGPR
jgi:hypothetical protein